MAKAVLKVMEGKGEHLYNPYSIINEKNNVG